jgi:hypothetical protein
MAPRLTRVARKALAVIVSDARGVPEHVFIQGHGYSRALLGGLARSGLVEVRREVVLEGDLCVQVGRVLITQKGRAALDKS